MHKKFTTKLYEYYVIENGKSYSETAKLAGCSKAAVARAAKRYRDKTKTVEVSTKEQAEDILGKPLTGNAHSVEKQIEELNKQLLIEKQKVADLLRSMGRNVRIVDVPENRFKVALISDTHYGSFYHHDGALKGFLEHAYESGVRHVLHAGDVLEGKMNHFGHEFELCAHGLTDQMAVMHDIYPRFDYMQTSFITGNHDNVYRKAIGVDVGQLIAADMGWDYLGDCFGEVRFQTESGGTYNVALLHPGGGTAYAMSYRLQKIIEQWEGGKKPDAIIVGHFHKSIWIPQYRNVSAFHPGCFQRQTPFMASKNSPAHVGGYILDITVGDEWKATKAEYVGFYK